MPLAKQVKNNAKALAKKLQEGGVRLVSGGTDNHLLLLDVTTLDLTGKEAEALLSEVNITTNKNTIPRETKSPFVTSGVRMGTAALTSRGMKEAEMEEIGQMIVDALKKQRSVEDIKKDVLTLVDKFPMYVK